MQICSCGAEIEFLEMATGKKMPYRPDSAQKRLVRFERGGLILGKIVDTYEPHFVDCPDADQYRRPK